MSLLERTALLLVIAMLLSIAASWAARPLLMARKASSSILRRAAPREAGLTRMLSTKESVYSTGMSGTSTEDTIFALSSGPMTKTGVAVIRLSGPACADVLTELQRVPEKLLSNILQDNQDSNDSKQVQKVQKQPPFPQPRRASLRRLYDPRSGKYTIHVYIMTQYKCI